jgi:alpha-galactosidase
MVGASSLGLPLGITDHFRRGVDFVKLDYITPGSPSNRGNLPTDNSGSVIAFHKAIQASNRPMRLDISWKLERNATYAPIWNSNADSMRTDQDINNSDKSSFVAWATVQRAIENYRQFITVVPVEVSSLMVHPDLDNLFVGNEASISGVSDLERTTMATHWIGAGANLLTGSDLTNLDTLGKKLLTWPAAWVDAAAFTALYPMQPRNPGSGGNLAKQLQSWIAGPNDSGAAYLVLVNYGPDQGQGGFGTTQTAKQTVTATWQDLGISGNYLVVDVWAGTDKGTVSTQLSASLDVGESRFFKLTKA